MGTARGIIWLWGAAMSMVLIAPASPALADVTTERSASILIFPKVLSDATGFQTGTPVDTVIQISNTSNSMVFAHCFYVNAVPIDSTRPAAPRNLRQWIEVDFEIALTKQQPTHWLVSKGRRNDATDNQSCNVDCSGAGFDPGVGIFSSVPPVTDPFTGELKCIEVDSSGSPINGNHLKGEATIVTRDGKADASKYNALGVIGLNTDTNTNNSDDVLCLGGGVTPSCRTGAEYNGCPQTVLLNHYAENATDPLIESTGNGNGHSAVNTELTLVPCSEDFENQIPSEIVVQFLLINEFEQLASVSTTIACWENLQLGSIGSLSKVFDVATLGSRFVHTRMTAASNDRGFGFVGVAEEFHHQPQATGKPLTARDAVNLHGIGERANGDTVTLPGSF